MACNKVALVVSSISKHCVCVCPNPLLPSEGLSAGEDVWGTLPFIGEEGDGTKPFRGEEGGGLGHTNIQEGLGSVEAFKGYYYIYPPYPLPSRYNQICDCIIRSC